MGSLSLSSLKSALLISSLVLNLLLAVTLHRSPSSPRHHHHRQRDSEDVGWSHDAAMAAEEAAAFDCNGHGDLYVDTVSVNDTLAELQCECYECFTGSHCADAVPDCDANVDRGLASLHPCPQPHWVRIKTLWPVFFVLPRWPTGGREGIAMLAGGLHSFSMHKGEYFALIITQGVQAGTWKSPHVCSFLEAECCSRCSIHSRMVSARLSDCRGQFIHSNFTKFGKRN